MTLPGILKEPKYTDNIIYSPMYNTFAYKSLPIIDETDIHDNLERNIQNNPQHTLLEDYDKALYMWLMSIIGCIVLVICVFTISVGYIK